jgi:hypothetical protein
MQRALAGKFVAPRFFGWMAAVAFLFATSVYANEVTQNTSFQNTDVTKRKASDESLQHSTSYAMTALMDLGNLNIPAAVNNGMTAYGKYRNSETLDKLGDQNAYRSSALSSATSGAPAVMRKTDTTFRRLDPNFLRQGPYNEVASEFEKRSGMKRETFLSQMSEISEKKIKRSDPQLVDKVIGRFENFIAKIPNADFRANLEKGVKMVPDSMRTGIISKAVQKFANPLNAAATTAATEVPVTAEKKEEPKAAEPVATPVVAEAPAEEPIAPAPDLSAPSRTPATADDGNNPLGNIIQAAIDTQENEVSIFQQVSKKYRSLTPILVN